MHKLFVLIFILLLALSGCASVEQSFYYGHPGRVSWGGGDLQLLFSNPDYADSTDPLLRQQALEDQLFGNKSPSVTGGVGLMQVWRF